MGLLICIKWSLFHKYSPGSVQLNTSITGDSKAVLASRNTIVAVLQIQPILRLERPFISTQILRSPQSLQCVLVFVAWVGSAHVRYHTELVGGFLQALLADSQIFAGGCSQSDPSSEFFWKPFRVLMWVSVFEGGWMLMIRSCAFVASCQIPLTTLWQEVDWSGWENGRWFDSPLSKVMGSRIIHRREGKVLNFIKTFNAFVAPSEILSIVSSESPSPVYNLQRSPQCLRMAVSVLYISKDRALGKRGVLPAVWTPGQVFAVDWSEGDLVFVVLDLPHRTRARPIGTVDCHRVMMSSGVSASPTVMAGPQIVAIVGQQYHFTFWKFLGVMSYDNHPKRAHGEHSEHKQA